MVTHIVLWKFHEEADGRSREENMRLAKEKLEALRGRIPGLLHIEVGLDTTGHPQAADVSLYSRLASWEALERYQVHPEHQAVLPFMRAVVSSRVSSDYESTGDDA